MKFSLEYLINSISPKDVIIISANPELNSKEPHLYLCIGKFDNQIQFVIASTQKDNIYKSVVVRKLSVETIVNVKKHPDSPLNKESWFDCNVVKSYSIQALVNLIRNKENFIRIDKRMLDMDYERIINSICMSEIVEQEFIDYLNQSNRG